MLRKQTATNHQYSLPLSFLVKPSN